MQFKDYYKIMGLEESATSGEIKKTYKRQGRWQRIQAWDRTGFAG